MYRKEIVYDHETHDYAMYLDGELVGFARTYREAEVTLDQLVFELMAGMFFTREQAPDAQADDQETNPTDEEGPCDDINAPPNIPRTPRQEAIHA